MTLFTPRSEAHEAPALELSHLAISVPRARGRAEGVSDVSLTIAPGERLGVVGESGSGKSLTMRAVLGLLPSRAEVVRGEVSYFGRRLSSQREIQHICSVVFQEALSALNPTRRVGDVIADGVQASAGLNRPRARERALELMNEVGIPEPETRYRQYAHSLSGGLRQRVMIAAALSTDPQVLVCDEPTTALDVTIQKQIIDLLMRLTQERGMTLVFISHDLGVVDELCDRVAVMYAGQVVEMGPTSKVLRAPRHPYTRALIDATLPVTHRVPFRPIPGSVPDPVDSIPGCRFAPRCSFARDECRAAEYALDAAGDRASACVRRAGLVEEGVL
ncbi:ABC transporter ATP-binding protein [Microbacterium tumbae]